MKRWFVTGTDTGVGKTTVSLAILAAARQRGLRTAAMKPAESGCPTGPEGHLVPADATSLGQLATLPAPPQTVCPYRFAAPVAPGVAAEAENQPIDFGHLRGCLADLEAASPDLLLVEGAGGLLVPMGQDRTIADLVTFLALPILIVARAGLGTINHSLLTIEAARARKIPIGAVILSDPTGDTPPAAATSNAHQIHRASGAPVSIFGHAASLTPDTLAPHAQATLPLAHLLPTRST